MLPPLLHVSLALRASYAPQAAQPKSRWLEVVQPGGNAAWLALLAGSVGFLETQVGALLCQQGSSPLVGAALDSCLYGISPFP